MAPLFKECSYCHSKLPLSNFIPIKCQFFCDGYLPICADCIAEFMESHSCDLDFVNRLCQWADIPFLPEKWEELYRGNGNKTFALYCRIVLSEGYCDVNWASLNERYRKAMAQGTLYREVPALTEEEVRQLRENWGENYTNEELYQLENLFQSILNTQNISSTLQGVDVRRICKLSLIIDDKIREGADFKDDLANYDKLVKLANLTAKDTKNAADFNSVGELFAYLEKKGWINRFYDGETRDVVDETMKNIQAYCRNLYINETGIGEEVNRRIEALKTARELQDQYDNVPEDDLDSYSIEGYDLESQEFKEEIE